MKCGFSVVRKPFQRKRAAEMSKLVNIFSAGVMTQKFATFN